MSTPAMRRARILKHLAAKQPRTIHEIAKALKLPAQQVRRALKHPWFDREPLVGSAPGLWKLSAEGKKREREVTLPGRIAEDMTGRHFGKWTGVRRVGNTSAGVMWLCVCDPDRGGCGVRRSVAAVTLRHGRSKGCQRCAATARHATTPTIRHRLKRNTQPIWPRTCKRCVSGFTGTANQQYCGPACRPPVGANSSVLLLKRPPA